MSLVQETNTKQHLDGDVLLGSHSDSSSSSSDSDTDADVSRGWKVQGLIAAGAVAFLGLAGWGIAELVACGKKKNDGKKKDGDMQDTQVEEPQMQIEEPPMLGLQPPKQIPLDHARVLSRKNSLDEEEGTPQGDESQSQQESDVALQKEEPPEESSRQDAVQKFETWYKEASKTMHVQFMNKEVQIGPNKHLVPTLRLQAKQSADQFDATQLDFSFDAQGALAISTDGTAKVLCQNSGIFFLVQDISKTGGPDLQSFVAAYYKEHERYTAGKEDGTVEYIQFQKDFFAALQEKHPEWQVGYELNTPDQGTQEQGTQ